MFKNHLSTLKLFAWVFYIGGGALSLAHLAQNLAEGAAADLYFSIDAAWAFALLGGGLYLVTHVKKLLPKHRREVLFVVTAEFAFSVVYSSVLFFMWNAHPLGIEPSIGPDTSFVWGAYLAGILFSALVYMVMVNAINGVAGVKEKHSKDRSVIYMAIVITVFVVFLGAIFWDPATGTFNVL